MIEIDFVYSFVHEINKPELTRICGDDRQSHFWEGSQHFGLPLGLVLLPTRRYNVIGVVSAPSSRAVRAVAGRRAWQGVLGAIAGLVRAGRAGQFGSIPFEKMQYTILPGWTHARDHASSASAVSAGF
jgi:hypothetical protein